jgi:hypothetical protein
MSQPHIIVGPGGTHTQEVHLEQTCENCIEGPLNGVRTPREWRAHRTCGSCSHNRIVIGATDNWAAKEGTGAVQPSFVEHGPRAATAFAYELRQLSAPYQAYVLAAFDAICQEWFWHVPASLGGKHHPKACRTLGGLVAHTRLAFWWSRRLLERMPETPPAETADIVGAAILLHDLCKFKQPAGVELGVELANATAVEAHGHWCAQALFEAMLPALPEGVASILHDAIRWHMGRWSFGWCEGLRQLFIAAELVAAADYLAAQHVDDVLRDLAAGGGK